MKFQRHPTILRQLVTVFLLASCASISGCAHTRGVEKTFDHAIPIADTGIVTPGAPVQNEILVEGEPWSVTGVVRGRVRRVSEGTQEFTVETRRRYKVIPYEWSDAIVLRAIVAPIYFGLLGPLWAEVIPDYAGDGSVGLGDRVRHSLAMLNFFEAFPNSRASERREEVAAVTTERRPATVELPSAPGEMTLELILGEHREALKVTLQQGAFAIDMRPALHRFFGYNAKATLVGNNGEKLELDDFGRQQVAEVLLRTGPFDQDPHDIAPENRKLAKELLSYAAATDGTPKARAVELFNRLHELEGGEAAAKKGVVPGTASAHKVVDANVAARDGTIQINARGIDLYRISVSVTNLTDHAMTVRIPAGTLFDCAGSAQDMLTTRALEVRVSPKGRSVQSQISAACANMSKATPVNRDSFELGDVSDPRLSEIAPHLEGLSRNVRQAVVWIITDNATLSTFRRYSTPAIRRKEVLQAIATFERAGVSIEDRAIWKWYTDGK